MELAKNHGRGALPINIIAQRQDISIKYLEQLMATLKSAGFVKSIKGPKGGYILAKPPEEITLEEIFIVLEGDISLVECTTNPKICSRTTFCSTRDIWKLISEKISGVLQTMTLKDLAKDAKKKLNMISFTYQI